jgi:hypothetical protein
MTTTVMIAKLLLGLLWCSAVSITAFAPPLLPMSSITSSQAQTSTLRQRTTQDTSSVRMHGSIIEGLVEFDTLAREWRCKYEDEASLISAQMALESVLEDIQEVDGVKSVERIVCGTCLDFKVRTRYRRCLVTSSHGLCVRTETHSLSPTIMSISPY